MVAMKSHRDLSILHRDLPPKFRHLCLGVVQRNLRNGSTYLFLGHFHRTTMTESVRQYFH